MTTVREIMTENPKTLSSSSTVADAARCMADADIGAVLVQDGDELKGIVTDRDIAVRCVGAGHDPTQTKVGDICTVAVTRLASDSDVDEAVQTMRRHLVRRLPVTEDGRTVGMLSLGDLAVARDPKSVLGQISASSPNN